MSRTKVDRENQFAAAAAEGGVVIAPTRSSTSLAALFAGHILQDGEVVLIITKPSLWFVLLSAIRFVAIVLILMIAAALFDSRLPGRTISYEEIGAVALASRLMWGVLVWMGRLYILTDLRVIRLSGVFTIEIFDCPLRKISRTKCVRPMRERLLGLGTIEIPPCDSSGPGGTWNTIARPVEVHDQIIAAINRANQNPLAR